jgi:hypothetical protein
LSQIRAGEKEADNSTNKKIKNYLPEAVPGTRPQKVAEPYINQQLLRKPGKTIACKRFYAGSEPDRAHPIDGVGL